MLLVAILIVKLKHKHTLIYERFCAICLLFWGQAAGYQPRPQAGG